MPAVLTNTQHRFNSSLSSRGNVLIIEDDELIQELLTLYVRQAGFSYQVVASGEEGWTLLEAKPDYYDTVLLDKNLPGIEGLELLKKLKKHPTLCGLPVILETAEGSDDAILEGLKLGAYYYLPKPIDKTRLTSVLKTSVGDYRRYKLLKNEVQNSSQVFKLLQQGSFKFQSLLSCQRLAIALASVFPQPERVIIGLSELMINAVEHGNLEISYQEKSKLIEGECWVDEIDARLEQPEFSSRVGEVSIVQDKVKIVTTITDQGKGFDWHPYLSVSIDRVFDQHGRGIAMANDICFDSLQYQGKGNQVVCTVYR